MQPRYPVYIVSKGRWKTRLTSRALDAMGVAYKMIVEESQLLNYQAEIGRERCLVLPQKYLDEYDTCDDLGDSKSKGPGAARNFAWDHAIALGAERHWVMDDNLDAFHRLNRNMKRESDTPAVFAAMEDFVDRYENVPIAGPNYYNFVKATDGVPAFTLNTRIYSCLLIQNDAPYRWRGRYNEDTDLSLRVLKDGLCTIQFNAFLQGKVTTQRMKGGNTGEFYEQEGTKAKSEMLAALHPDVASVVWRFNRWHHHVNYKPFKKNRLKRKPDIDVPRGINNYGMELVDVAS
ncbi:MAG: hypothetical protein VW202_06250 [Halieaceae bacterium]